MKNSSRVEGFTIVETLIVLAVTGFLFTAAAITISGRQNSTQFTQAVRDIESRLQKTINEVATGYYPNNGSFRCTAGAAPIISTGSTGQGSNTGCIFLGKAVQFAVHGTDPQAYNVYSLVGLRANAAGPVTSLAAANPRIINLPAVIEAEPMPYGLTVVGVHYDNANPYDPANTSRAIGSIGFVSRITNPTTQNATQQVDLRAIRGTARDQTQGAGIASIESNIVANAVVNPANGVQICLRSGSTNQSALMTVGGNGRQLTVSTSIKYTGNCT